MPILTSTEERQKKELQEERKRTFINFFEDLKNSFLIWIKIGASITGGLIILYLIATFLFKWDLFYETGLNFRTIFLAIFIFFLVAVGICWLVALFLYNTKHRRNTKYKAQDIGRGGQTNG